MEDNSDGDNNCVAGIDQIACYEEKKLLIQNAEERCDNLKNQLDYLRIILTQNTDYDGQNEEMKYADICHSKEDEFNFCDISEMQSNFGAEQLYLEHQSSPRFMLPEKYDQLEENYLDGGDFSRFVPQDAYETEHYKGLDSKNMDGLQGMSGDYDLMQMNYGYLPEMTIPKGASAEPFSHTALKLDSAIGDAYEESLDREENITEFNSRILRHKGNIHYDENKCATSSTSHIVEESQEEFIGTKGMTMKQNGKKGDDNKECKLLRESTPVTRKEIKVVKKNVKEIEQVDPIKQSTNPREHVKRKASPTTKDHKTEQRSKAGCLTNYRRLPLNTSIVISATTIPTSNFKKEEDERHLHNKKALKTKRPSMNAEKWNVSKYEQESKTATSSQYLHVSRNWQKGYEDKVMVNVFPVSKTGSEIVEKLSDYDSKKIPAVKSAKAPSNKIGTSNYNQGQSAATKCRTRWADVVDGSGRMPCKSATDSPNLNMQPISVTLIKKAPNSSHRTTKTKDKNKLCPENDEKNKNKSRTLRNGFGLHTISSKLKMSEKSHDQRPSSKYPFVVGKATTPSHNLVLNIQQTLSIIKMKPPVVHSQSVTNGAVECHDFPSVITTDGLMRSTLTMDPVMFVQTRSSMSGIQNCPLINQNNGTTCVVQNDIIQTQDWFLFQEKYGDASVNKCQCYPRNCTHYNKVINHYLNDFDEMQFFHNNEGSQTCLQQKRFPRMAVNNGETIRERLTQTLRQIQTFQFMLTSKQGI